MENEIIIGYTEGFIIPHNISLLKITWDKCDKVSRIYKIKCHVQEPLFNLSLYYSPIFLKFLNITKEINCDLILGLATNCKDLGYWFVTSKYNLEIIWKSATL